jgi:hypothetical protein
MLPNTFAVWLNLDPCLCDPSPTFTDDKTKEEFALLAAVLLVARHFDATLLLFVTGLLYKNN